MLTTRRRFDSTSLFFASSLPLIFSGRVGFRIQMKAVVPSDFLQIHSDGILNPVFPARVCHFLRLRRIGLRHCYFVKSSGCSCSSYPTVFFIFARRIFKAHRLCRRELRQKFSFALIYVFLRAVHHRCLFRNLYPGTFLPPSRSASSAVCMQLTPPVAVVYFYQFTSLRKPLSGFDLLWCLSFLSAFASIWRILSLVILNSLPTSSSVFSFCRLQDRNGVLLPFLPWGVSV